MAAVEDSLSLKGGPLRGGGLRVRDGRRNFWLREAEHGHPAASGQEEHDHDRDTGPEQIGATPGAAVDGRTAMAKDDQKRSRLQRQEQGQDDGQQPVHDGGLSPAA